VLQIVPHHRALGFLARQLGFAETVFQSFEGNLHLVAYLHLEHALLIAELLDGDNAFALQTGVDHHDVVTDFHNDTGDDGARLQLGDGLLALFKQFGKTFSHVDSIVGKDRGSLRFT
jgi:hypothetical protein